MSKMRLKPAAKIGIMLLAAGVLITAFIFLRPLIIPEGKQNQSITGLMAGGPTAASNDAGAPAVPNKCIEIGVVTWGGYVGGQYWNNGFKDNPGSRYHKDGICVNFHVMDDFSASRAAFKAGKMDLMWVTIDAFPTESGNYGENIKFLFQADWSRGGDAIVVKSGIESVGALAGKKIAVAEATPSHTFLLWMLDMAGLSVMDVTIVTVPSAIDAATAFKSGKVDAAVVWSPDDSSCVKAVANSKVLVNTKQASNIIADGFMVKDSVFKARKPELKKLVEGWLKGAAEINGSKDAQVKAAKILSDGLGADVNEEFALGAINNVRLTTLGDNLDFFGLAPEYKGITGKTLYEKMTVVYGKLNLAKGSLPYASIVDTDFIKSLSVGTAAVAAPEAKVEFKAPATPEQEKAKAVASKPVRISFASGVAVLDDNAKSIIDLMFVEQAKAFPSSRIRIEGNTDKVGSDSVNIPLSKKRAQSVVDYLVSAHAMDKNRFVVVGNGSTKPLCPEASEGCMAKNRRTDFQILEN